jgi:hypothetical protein
MAGSRRLLGSLPNHNMPFLPVLASQTFGNHGAQYRGTPYQCRDDTVFIPFPETDIIDQYVIREKNRPAEYDTRGSRNEREQAYKTQNIPGVKRRC